MLSVERVKELLNDPKISDTEAEEIRGYFNILAETIFEKWVEDKKKEKESEKKEKPKI